MPARAGVDSTKHTNSTILTMREEKMHGGGLPDEPAIEVDIFMGDQGEVMLKRMDRPSDNHRRWYAAGIKEIMANIKSLMEARGDIDNRVLYVTTDNKDRRTFFTVEDGRLRAAGDLGCFDRDEYLIDVDWTDAQKALKKAIK